MTDATESPAAPAAPVVIVGVDAIAAAFNRERHTIGRWIRDEGFPVAILPNGEYATSPEMVNGWLRGRATPLLQLRAARCDHHKVVLTRYAEAVVRGELTEAQARARYAKAMECFDANVSRSCSGAAADAVVDHMSKGADHLPDYITSLRASGGRAAAPWDGR